jgi:proteic killer suppression protein
MSADENGAGAVTIQSFRNDEASEILRGSTPKGVHRDIAKAARRRLAQLDAAVSPQDMAVPPGNRLHKVGDDVWSVSVNDQYRLTFKWGPSGPEEVWFGDYH